MFTHDARVLAAERRRNLFAGLTENIGAVVTCNPFNKGYLSGYFSMSNDTSASYRTAAIATREGAVLVVGAADAGPALECLRDADRIFRYGTFYFEAAGEAAEGLDYDLPGFADFESALAHALDAAIPKGTQLGVDDVGARTDGVASVLPFFRS